MLWLFGVCYFLCLVAPKTRIDSLLQTYSSFVYSLVNVTSSMASAGM